MFPFANINMYEVIDSQYFDTDLQIVTCKLLIRTWCLKNIDIQNYENHMTI